ncbi:MAG: hypothetical protein GYB36_03645 [Alphaproteobacteria bacterium]|nr:hypothetical protein [Alphaproteobacteria bacterium]
MSATKWDYVRGLAVLSGAIAQVAFGALPFILEWENTVGSRSNEVASLLTPASYAFSIWSVIFAGCAVFAVYHFLRPSHAPLRRIGWYAAFAFWGNAIWEIYVPFQGFDFIAMGLILIIWVITVSGMAKAVSDTAAGWTDRIIRAPLFLLGGWLNAAAFVNVLITASVYNFPWIGTGEPMAALAVLGVAVLAALDVIWRLRSLSYAAAISWGLYAIHIANTQRGEALISQAALGAIGLSALVLVSSWAIRRNKT